MSEQIGNEQSYEINCHTIQSQQRRQKRKLLREIICLPLRHGDMTKCHREEIFINRENQGKENEMRFIGLGEGSTRENGTGLNR